MADHPESCRASRHHQKAPCSARSCVDVIGVWGHHSPASSDAQARTGYETTENTVRLSSAGSRILSSSPWSLCHSHGIRLITPPARLHPRLAWPSPYRHCSNTDAARPHTPRHSGCSSPGPTSGPFPVKTFLHQRPCFSLLKLLWPWPDLSAHVLTERICSQHISHSAGTSRPVPRFVTLTCSTC